VKLEFEDGDIYTFYEQRKEILFAAIKKEVQLKGKIQK